MTKLTQHLLPLSLGISLLLSGGVFAAPITVPITLKHATVFFNSAELQNEGEINLPEGQSDVIITGISDAITNENISLKLNPDITLLSTQIVQDPILEAPLSDIVKAYQQELDKLQDEHKALLVKKHVLDVEIAILESNKRGPTPGGFSGSTVGTAKEQSEILELVRERLEKALTDKIPLEKQLKESSERINKLEKQIADSNQGKDKPVTAVLVKLYSPKAVTTPVSLSYITGAVGWNPVYDVKLTNMDLPLKLVYKAELFQKTNLDWDNITITLTSYNPERGIMVPELYPWYVNIFDNNLMVANREKVEKFVLEDEVSYAKTAAVAAPALPLVNVDNSGINVNYVIQTAYTIKSSTSSSLITIKEEDIPATYRYIAVPKLSDGVFLQAQVSNWGKLNLLPGKMYTYLENKYSGESFLDTKNVTSDTLDISLGRDNNVLISQERDRHLTNNPSFFGNTITQQFGYLIKINNRRTNDINIMIQDQIPVSQNDDITISDLNYGGAEYDEKKGTLTWVLTLKPNENKELPFSFKVKYPKDKQVTNL